MKGEKIIIKTLSTFDFSLSTKYWSYMYILSLVYIL